MPISISSKLLDPYNSFEFLGFPNHTFSDPIPNFSNFLLDSESIELLNDFKINTIDSILAKLDMIDSDIFLDFNSIHSQKVEYHGEISYVRRANLVIRLSGKRILLRNIQFIKHMTRKGTKSSLFEFRIDFTKEKIPSYIPEFKELFAFLQQHDLIYRGLFLIGNESVPVAGIEVGITETVNKYFISFFDKGNKKNAKRYTEAFQLVDNFRDLLIQAVRIEKGDALNVH